MSNLKNLVQELEISNIRLNDIFGLLSNLVAELDEQKGEKAGISKIISQINMLINFGRQLAVKQEESISKLWLMH